jgi:phospholipase/carboxylesterase/glyoxalase family protein
MSGDFTHRFVPAATLAAPTLLALHGTGGDENDLIPLARMISTDSAVLSPRGRVLEQGMPRFFRRIAEGVFDLEDLRVRTDELASFISDAATRYGFDPARVVAIGYSNGANIAASLMLSHPGVLAGGILLRPMVPFEPDTLPDLRGTRVLVSAGRQDPIVPAASTERLTDLLQQAGADVMLAWHDAGHALLPREMEQAARWFGQQFAV